MPKSQQPVTASHTHRSKPKHSESFNTAMKDALTAAIREKNASNGHTITLIKPKSKGIEVKPEIHVTPNPGKVKRGEGSRW